MATTGSSLDAESGRDTFGVSPLIPNALRKTLELLRCPGCHGELRVELGSIEEERAGNGSLRCDSCNETFAIREGIPRLLLSQMREAVASNDSTTPVVATALSFGFEWNQFPEMRPEWERNFLEYQAPHEPNFFLGKRVLDAGCGSGRHAYHAAQFGAEVWAMDLGSAVEVAKRNTTDSPGVHVVQGDIYNPPFQRQGFDYIYSLGVLHHLPAPDAGLRSLLELLKPGGEFQVYLYWRPEGQPLKSALLAVMSALRTVTTRLPFRAVYAVSYPVAWLAFGCFVWPYRIMRHVPGLRSLAERMPMKQYSQYPFRVCLNDQFDRLSAPIENRYTKKQVEAFLTRAGLDVVYIGPNCGWVATGRKPLTHTNGVAKSDVAEPLRSETRAGNDNKKSRRDLRVLCLASYPVEAASTRFRVTQFAEPLAKRGITLDVQPFLTSRQFQELYHGGATSRKALSLTWAAMRRLLDARLAPSADIIFVQREAMIFAPPLVEWLSTRFVNRPLVLDLDDATYIPYTSPTYGRVASWVKCFGKTDRLIRWAKVVTCGNRAIAEHVEGLGTRAVILPTIVDTDKFRSADVPNRSGPLVLGWVGTHSTYPYMKTIFPVLERLARDYQFRLKIIGSNQPSVQIPGVVIENLDWRLDREIDDFRSIDIGLYPIIDDSWSSGKSGFKAIQYMSVGVPYVASPVGAAVEIGMPGLTHLLATTPEEWSSALSQLLTDTDLRIRMGENGRRHALENYTIPDRADAMAEILRGAAR